MDHGGEALSTKGAYAKATEFMDGGAKKVGSVGELDYSILCVLGQGLQGLCASASTFLKWANIYSGPSGWMFIILIHKYFLRIQV